MRRWVDTRPTARDQSGFTLLELVIVIILVALLFTTAWWRLMPLRGDAESAHVAATIGTLRSALGLQVVERIVEDSVDATAALDGTNPMAFLEPPPPNYIGEVASAAGAEIPAGSWYFERDSRELRYRVRFPRYLDGSSGEEPLDLSWQVQLSFRDADGNGEFEAGVDALRAIRLLALDNPGWSDPEENIPVAPRDS